MDKYQILEAYSTYDLEKQVNDKISSGWKPLGGVSVIRGLTEDTFIQAIVRDLDA